MFHMQQVGRNIVELRKKINMTQMELADRMNISFQAVSNWERGNSMPDISKLPELADIFGISVDTLIGDKSKLVQSVISNNIKECVENNEVSNEEIEEYIPILKPEHVETIAKSMNLSKVDNISAFLPYLDDEMISVLAQEKVDKGESIISFLSYLEEEDVAKFAQQLVDKGESIISFLSYLEEEDVAKFAQQLVDKGESIISFLSYLEEEDVAKFAQQLVNKGESIVSFLPYLAEEDIVKFAQLSL